MSTGSELEKQTLVCHVWGSGAEIQSFRVLSDKILDIMASKNPNIEDKVRLKRAHFE
jgi:hypothetical protein